MYINIHLFRYLFSGRFEIISMGLGMVLKHVQMIPFMHLNAYILHDFATSPKSIGFFEVFHWNLPAPASMTASSCLESVALCLMPGNSCQARLSRIIGASPRLDDSY